MRGRNGIAITSALGLGLAATMSVAQTYDPEFIGYQYVYYADAAKTQYQGTVYDHGCGGSGEHVYVVRAFVPSVHVDTIPIFYCGNGQIEPILV